MGRFGSLTRISNADFHIASHKVRLRLCESLAKTLRCSEFNIAESLGLVVELVFHYADSGDLAIGQKGFHFSRGHIVGQVAKMSSIRGFGRERYRFTVGEPGTVYSIVNRGQSIRSVYR